MQRKAIAESEASGPPGAGLDPSWSAGAGAWARADQALDEGRVVEAERLYRGLLDADGSRAGALDSAAVHFRLAAICARGSRPDEAREHLRQGRDLAGAPLAPGQEMLALITEAWLEIQLDREPKALDPARRALDLALAVDAPAVAADARQCLGIASAVAGDPDAALDYLFDAFTYRHARGHRAKMLELLSNLGAVSLLSGHSETARGYLRRAVAIGVELGAGSRLGVVLMNLGILNMGIGHWDEAEANLKESVRLHHAAGNWRRAIEPTVSLARLAVMRRRFQEAASYLADVERVADESRQDRYRAWIVAVTGELAMAEGAFEAARERFDALVDLIDRGNARTVAGAFRRRAQAGLALAELELAEADAAEALRAARAAGDRVEEALSRRVTSEIAFSRGDHDRAANDIHRAVDLLRATGYRPELAGTLLQLVDSRIAVPASAPSVRPEPATIEDALLDLAEAERIYQLLSHALGLARCHLQRARVQMRAGMVDRALASLDRARPVIESQGLPADRQRLRQVHAELEGEMARASTGQSDHYAGLARALVPVREGVDPEAYLALFSQVARAVAADRLFAVRSSPESDEVVATHRISRRRAAELWRWLGTHLYPPDKERQPLLVAKSLRDLPERFFPHTGSIALLPARSAHGDFEVILFVERRAEHPAGVLTREQIDFLRASTEALAELDRGGPIGATASPHPRPRSARAATRFPPSGTAGFIAASPGMRRVIEQVERLAESDVPVLVHGETGVGKERIARAIHDLGQRRAGLFVPFMAAGLGHELIESQLFGHVRGAFTGADRDRQGLLKAADGGTFFLDEVGEMPLTVQVSFLRFLETGEFRRIGESELSRAKIRVVSATHRDLRAEVKAGRFRQDLYYRLAPVVLEVPPLRERIEDISLLVEHFLRVYAVAAGKPNLRLAAAVEEAFLSYPWPGNVRELENEVRRVVALSGGHREVGLDLLSAEIAAGAGQQGEVGSKLPLDEEQSRRERRRIIQALTDADWNQTRAARTLGLKRTTLIARMKRHGILR
jgi:DNA-binding NtrC family response regulator/tetratricopeptide (TPR) repeat protein